MDFAERMKKARENKASKEDKDRFVENLIMSLPDKFRSYYQRVPRIHVTKMISSFNNKTSKKLAISCKCLECSNFSRNEIIMCQVRTCALWGVRPYQEKSEIELEDENDQDAP